MKLGIAGANGRMGRALLQAAAANHIENVLAHARDLTTLSEQTNTTDSLDQLVEQSDAVIDFTRPELTTELAKLAGKHKTPLISGTTGLDDLEQLAVAALHAPIVWSPNMSIGVNLLMGLVKQAAEKLDESYDIEIMEMHHRYKVDAPSGTALGLGRAAAEGRNIDFDKHATLSREGNTGEREMGTIGFATARGGSVIGDHTVIFAGDHDRIELTHKSQDRSIYAEGAVKAAIWSLHQPPGLYDMMDVLGLR